MMDASTIGNDVAAPSLGTISDGVHKTAFRMYVEDTDAGGVVYHAKYLHFFERARTQLLNAMGFGLHAMMNAEGDDYRVFVVRRADVSYLAPARLDDVLTSVNRVARLGGASIDFDQRLQRDGQDIATATIYVGCVDRAGKPRRLPTLMKTVLEQLTNR